jgi:hypothetical protein
MANHPIVISHSHYFAHKRALPLAVACFRVGDPPRPSDHADKCKQDAYPVDVARFARAPTPLTPRWPQRL